MKIAIQRTGGFAGFRRTGLGRYGAAAACGSAAHRGAGGERRVLCLPTALGGEITGADLFQLRITVTDGARRHTVEFPDHESPELATLRALVRSLAPLTNYPSISNLAAGEQGIHDGVFLGDLFRSEWL